MATEPAAAPAAVAVSDGRIRIRPYHPDDAGALLAAVLESLDSLSRWLPWCHADYAENDACEWIAHCIAAWRQGDEFAFCIGDAASGEFLGGVGLNQCDRARASANLGYWVRQSRQGRGIAPAAARLAAGFGFDTLALRRIEIVVLNGNVPSRRVAQKLGAVRQSGAQRSCDFRGQAVAADVYALSAR